jgi:hypothetical protein
MWHSYHTGFIGRDAIHPQYIENTTLIITAGLAYFMPIDSF